MITDETRERVSGWFAGRLPQEWQAVPAGITIDREEITVRLSIPDVDLGDDASAGDLELDLGDHGVVTMSLEFEPEESRDPWRST